MTKKWRPGDAEDWDNSWKRARSGLDSWTGHRDIFEAGADAIIEAIEIKLKEQYDNPDIILDWETLSFAEGDLQMANKWRPPNWENPYNFISGEAIPKYEIQSKIFEAGADAILVALREMGNDPKQLLGLTQLFQNHKVVFIPDEEE